MLHLSWALYLSVIVSPLVASPSIWNYLTILLFFPFASVIILFLTILSRWDIIAERLGFMLVFGDLVWIPFTFSIQVYKIKWCFSYLKSSLSVFIISYNKIISFIIFSFQVDGFWHSKSGQCIPYETIFTLFDMPQQIHQPFSNLWMTNIHSWSSSSWLCTIESHLLKKIYIG